MATSIPAAKQYDDFAPSYSSVESLPTSHIETQLIRLALGDCTSLSILDLGGGNGIHARRAVDSANAESVDVVDISKEMLRLGESIPSPNSHKIRWFEADVSKPLPPSLGLKGEGEYDIVMANWVFDHATSQEELEGMWENVARYLKPGGKFLGVRVRHLKASYLKQGKYGVIFKDLKEIPGEEGGWKFQCVCLTEPPFEFGVTSLRATWELDHSVPTGLGLDGFEVLNPKETDVVKGDPAFWEDFLKEPFLVVVVGKKA